MTLKAGLAILAFVALPMIAADADWAKAKTLPGVDLAGLSAPKQAVALKILRDQGCSCGCGMKVAECRVKDPGCGYSTNMAKIVVDSLKAGKSEAETVAVLQNSPWSKGPQQVESKLLDDAVTVPVYGAPSKGPANAPVTLVEFSDFQCPYCAVAIGQIDAAMKARSKDVRLIFKQYPLEQHPQAQLAAAAALAANKQGKFWEMHDALFANRTNLSRPSIQAIAGKLGLDMKKFDSDWDSPEIREQIVRDTQDGESVRVEGTPTLFINGQRFNAQITADSLESVIDDQLKQAKR